MVLTNEDDGKMAGEAQSFFLVPASSGQCVEQRLGELHTNDLNGQEQQRWRLEYDPEDSDNVAFKNVLSDAYLCFSNGIMGARVMTRSGTSQYFRLETSNTPGALRIQSVNYPKTYLCNSHGNWSVNNQAITWVREPHLTRTTLWYIVDHNVWKAQKEQLYRPDSAISIHGSSRHVSATARGRSDVQLELQRTEFRDDTLPDPEPPSTPVEEKLAEEEQFSDTKDSMPVEIEHQLTDIEKVVTGLVEAKERNVADGGRWFLAREAKAEADTSVKAPQQSSSEGGRERPSDAEEEAARKSLGDQTQAAERERLQGEHPGITPDIDKAQEQAERGSPSAGGIPGVEPSQEGLLVVEPSENAESLTPKPEPIATEPESLRTKVSVEYRSGQKAGIPHPAQVGTLEQGIGAPKLEDAEIGAPDVNPPLRIDPQRDGIGAPSPSLPRTLESAFERPFGFFDLGDRNGGRPALRPIVMQTGFSHLKRL